MVCHSFPIVLLFMQQASPVLQIGLCHCHSLPFLSTYRVSAFDAAHGFWFVFVRSSFDALWGLWNRASVHLAFFGLSIFDVTLM